MIPRLVGSTVILILGTAASALGQGVPPSRATLPAFRSDQEIVSYLRQLAVEREHREWIASKCQNGVTLARAKGATAVVTGTVADQSGTPISGASVSLGPSNAAGASGADGRYRLVPSPGTWQPGDTLTLVVRSIGHRPERRAFTLAPGDSLEVNFGLCSDALLLQGITVAAAQAVTIDGLASITNTQHAGVDEGDIVKLHGNHLIVLRRGRLFTVTLGRRELGPTEAVDAFGPGIDPAYTWYDELIVWGDKIVVIGYSYERGGTELGVFRIGPTGRLRHLDTYHLRSNDYYSSRNYASRLVHGKLVFYAPMYLEWDWDDPLAALPAMRRWDPKAEGGGRFERIAAARRVYRPAGASLSSDDVTLHTVTSCDLAREPLTCEATVMIGPPGRVFYVSPEAVYVWLSEWRRWRSWPGGAAPALLARLPLDGSSPSALGVAGAPTDQFSFLESGDGYLNVLVRSEAWGDAMWAPEWADGAAALLRVRLASFGDGSQSAPAAQYRPLPAPGERATFQNRFVGEYLLYGTGSGWIDQKRNSATLFVVPWKGGALSRLPLPHGVDRIEMMGADAVVVGADEQDLHFTGIRLTDAEAGGPHVAQEYRLANVSQGELRSHGFFYRADGTDSGVLGLPVRGPGRPGYEHLFEGSASVLFLANRDGRFLPLGELEARAQRDRQDWCKASCIDWYGNARPIFIEDRVFALLGYELVEGRIRGGRIRELWRLSYAPQAARTVRR
jgi:hypothetical protein